MKLKYLEKFINAISKLHKNSEGAIAIIAALAMVFLCGVVALVVDFSFMAARQSNMQNSLDAGVLAAGVEMSRGERDNEKLQATFTNYFYTNISNLEGDEKNFKIVKFESDWETGKIAAEVETTFQPVIAEILPMLSETFVVSKEEVSAEGSAAFGTGTVEVAMVLDVTGSMGWRDSSTGKSRLTGLKSSAIAAINSLLDENGPGNIRIGLVPYGSSINAGEYASKVTKNNRSRHLYGYQFYPNYNVSTSKCVTGRAGSYASTDMSYENRPLGSDRRSLNGRYSSYRCPTAKVQALTDDRELLIKEIKDYKANGGTAGHLGIAWGYYLLSENWRSLFAKENKPEPYTEAKNTKVVILMTDGDFNVAYTDLGWYQSPFSGSARYYRSREVAQKLCEDMKEPKGNNGGIIIYSIAFDIRDGSSADTLMKACATDEDNGRQYYFKAENSQQLSEAFRQISGDISDLRVTN